MADQDRVLVAAIEAEFRRYRSLGEGAIAQMHDHELGQAGPGGGSSVTIIVWHIGGNLTSRFTEFLTTDGEKPGRDRDSEFIDRQVSRGELLAHWEKGWAILFESLAALSDAHLKNEVTIRRQRYPVHEALLRALAHISYHVGQIVYLAKSARGSGWKTLSIPLGGSAAFNDKGLR
ncbi:MAG: DUF1572 family protein [Vicinamibacterales bacterium]